MGFYQIVRSFLLVVATALPITFAQSETLCTLNCVNGGECKFSPHDENEPQRFHCQCPQTDESNVPDSRSPASVSGWQGTYCEIPFTACSIDDGAGGRREWRCLNGGTCSDDFKAGCICAEEFAGDHCQHYSGPCSEGDADCVRHEEMFQKWGSPATQHRRPRRMTDGEIVGVIFFTFCLGVFAAFLALQLWRFVQRRQAKARNSNDVVPFQETKSHKTHPVPHRDSSTEVASSAEMHI